MGWAPLWAIFSQTHLVTLLETDQIHGRFYAQMNLKKKWIRKVRADTIGPTLKLFHGRK
jgi:hypothetical protein